MAEFSYNNSIHAASKVSPFFANYGFYPRFNISLFSTSLSSNSTILLGFSNNNLLHRHPWNYQQGRSMRLTRSLTPASIDKNFNIWSDGKVTPLWMPHGSEPTTDLQNALEAIKAFHQRSPQKPVAGLWRQPLREDNVIDIYHYARQGLNPRPPDLHQVTLPTKLQQNLTSCIVD